ncbi:TonB C-terminal domain-containing protein [Motilimonas cestriensis]|uniref:TonB C-terminal domain-containing protein n=1 Tax=Motilimonas cestriensis TaxID=2742685 RepID=A0ABS8W812_9GAMM|nr:TonB C-terminal domain-containing protein [Motilimonas cestriensis]MCE2593944.1 TonB C-terminal domain-containing protein [Motilimonas cestriensis]
MKMKKTMIIAILTALIASPAALAMTTCKDLAHCQQAMQESIYQHWKARHSYPGASVTVMVNNDLMGNVDISVEQSSGFAKFDQSAIEALKNSILALDPSSLSEEELSKLKTFRLSLKAE